MARLDHGFQDEAETFPGIGEQILPLFQYKYHSTIPERRLSPRPSNETIITDVTMGQPSLTRPPETTTNPIHSGEGEGGYLASSALGGGHKGETNSAAVS